MGKSMIIYPGLFFLKIKKKNPKRHSIALRDANITLLPDEV